MGKIIVIAEDELRKVVSETIKEEIKNSQMNMALSPPTNETLKADTRDLLTRKEAATYLGVSLPTLHKWTKESIVKGYRINRSIRYVRSELESSLKNACSIK